jgi:RNA-directed DNA polymerase
MREADADTRAEMLSRTSKTDRGTAGERESVRHARPARGESSGHEALTLIEHVVRREHLVAAHARVVRNGGAPGVDDRTVDALMSYCRQHWARVREQLLSGTYVPHPVRRVEIPKPEGKGVRTLGIPTVLDRFIHQALLQVLSPIFDPTFSDASFGCRPGRSTHQAVQRARGYIAAGHRWVVDVDLEKFFDRVNHDVLMARVARRVKDTRWRAGWCPRARRARPKAGRSLHS